MRNNRITAQTFCTRFLLIVLVMIMAGCARACEGCRRDIQTSSRQYHIEQYSGGRALRRWDFRGILNNQESSDGFYFYVGDTLVEISGDLIITSTD